MDLFAGGCAITHAAILSGKYEKFIVNDIGDAPQVFINAIKGEYKNKNRWISREQFFKEREQNPFIKYIWSFGNNGSDFLYGKDVEKYRFLQKSKRLEHEERIKRINRLFGLCDTSKIEVQKSDYKNVEIPNNAIIYCDPPYLGTRGYAKNNKNDFDSSTFFDWVRNNKNAVFFSEYNAPECFWTALQKKVRSTYSATNNSAIKVEKLFCNDVAYELIKAERIGGWVKI